MAILGHILGIIVLILGIILVVGIIRCAINFDFDAPLFKTEITIFEKSNKPEMDVNGLFRHPIGALLLQISLFSPRW